MKGKYITTAIKMAALSGKKEKQSNNTKEKLAIISEHRIIWSKDRLKQSHSFSSAVKQEDCCLLIDFSS